MNAQPGPDGLLVVDKPAGWTSHDVVARVRRLAGTRKVGHAGTLDPMATGVLVLGLGRATRLLTYVVGADKEYRATIRLGQSTSTDDAEGRTTDAVGAADVDPGALSAAVRDLTGPIEQVPSSVSAIKVDGKRAYALARAGEQVVLAARSVVVHRFEVAGPRPGVADDGTAVVDLDATVVCSSGTYVRALARDLGAALGVGGHLVALRRTRVGGFTLESAVDVAAPGEAGGGDASASGGPPGGLVLLSVEQAARATFPVRELSADEARELSFGRRVGAGPVRGTREAPVAGFAPDGTLVALLADEAGLARPVLVLAPA
jgi:tRNA pseudouridine55 synthase